MQNNLNNENQEYDEKSITVLKGLEAVTTNIGMYVGGNDERGMEQCVKEVISNSVDEANAGKCNHIDVTLDVDGAITVIDNGRGIPVGIHPDKKISSATIVVTELHAGGKFKDSKTSYNRTGGLHGVGVSCVNALSSYFEMTIYRNSNVYYQRFTYHYDENKKKFIPAYYDEPLKVIDENITEEDAHKKYGFIGKTGTKIKFKLNKDLFSDKVWDDEKQDYDTVYYQINPSRIDSMLETLAFLNPNLKLTFQCYRVDDEELKIIEENFPNLKEIYSFDSFEKIRQLFNRDSYIRTVDTEKNISFGKTGENIFIKKTWVFEKFDAYLKTINKDMGDLVTEPFCVEREVQDIRKEFPDIYVMVAFQWYSKGKTIINSFANNIFTPLGGHHLTGFKRAISKAINNYVKDIDGKDKLIKEFKEITTDDILDGLVGIVSVKLSDPRFEGQTKEKLLSREADKAVYTAVYEYLYKLLGENPKLAKIVIDRIICSKNARLASQKAREVVVSNDKKSYSLSVPTKLADCQDKNPEACELFLVEGDSAGGSAKSARDKKYQAILPLKGKVINVQDLTLNRALSNSEISALVQTLGCGIGETFDINKLRYHKIIFMTDADVDGQHIRTLLATFFHKFLPQLIEKGYVYIAAPPLYRVKKRSGKNESYYLRDDNELSNFFLDRDENKWDVSRFKGLGEMNPDQLEDTTMNPKTRTIIKLSLTDEYKEITNQIFQDLMGGDSEKRKDFLLNNIAINNYESSSVI